MKEIASRFDAVHTYRQAFCCVCIFFFNLSPSSCFFLRESFDFVVCIVERGKIAEQRIKRFATKKTKHQSLRPK